uniref:Invertebrate defensins family profile domain-containing protein n=1 Tax=Glossina palpalis gambiensis TaxID=67801 RepID=A0A1B0BGY1_9MUSC
MRLIFVLIILGIFSLALSAESTQKTACRENSPSLEEHFPGVCSAFGGEMWCSTGCRQEEYDYGFCNSGKCLCLCYEYQA